MEVLIDDVRDGIGWDLVARNAKTAEAVLIKFEGLISLLGMDHDLGIGKTGHDVMKWAISCGKLPKQVCIVSGNAVGYDNMKHTLLDNGYVKEQDSNVYVKKE